MTMNVQVSCIKHTGSRDKHGHIIGIGGTHGGKRFYYLEADAIKEIRNKSIAFYTSVGNKSAWIIIESRNGHEYLKTEADSSLADNLLHLPQCP